MENQLMTVEQGGGDLSLSRPAEVVLREAEMVAGPWGKKVESLTLYKTIGDKKHLYIEAWQMMAAMYRVTARVRETRYLEMGEVKGFEAVAEAFHIPTGQVISTAEAMCTSDEEKWGPRPKYEYVDGKRERTGWSPTPLQQLRSMAQTRACSKVLSNLFKWVAVQKGYQGTPAEEMTGSEYEGEGKHQTTAPQRKSAPRQDAPPQGQHEGNGERLISEAQQKRLFAIGRQRGLSVEQYRGWLKQCGYNSDKEIPVGQYEALVEVLEAKE